jgi:drug/metabolite transporter (DMT)-like permease
MRKGAWAAITAALAWGYVYATTESIVNRMNPLALLSALYFTGGILLLPFVVSSRGIIMQGIMADPFGFASMSAGVLVAEYAIMASVSVMGGTSAALVEMSYPIWTALFLYLLKRVVPTPATFVGAAFIAIGTAVIVLSEHKS